MKASDAKTWATVALMAGGAYVVWKLWDKITGAGDAASKSLADAYVSVTAGPVVKVLASAVLPNGQKIPMAQLKVVDAANYIFQHTGTGKRYRLITRRPDNDYDAVLAGFSRRMGR